MYNRILRNFFSIPYSSLRRLYSQIPESPEEFFANRIKKSTRKQFGEVQYYRLFNQGVEYFRKNSSRYPFTLSAPLDDHVRALFIDFKNKDSENPITYNRLLKSISSNLSTIDQGLTALKTLASLNIQSFEESTEEIFRKISVQVNTVYSPEDICEAVSHLSKFHKTDKVIDLEKTLIVRSLSLIQELKLTSSTDRLILFHLSYLWIKSYKYSSFSKKFTQKILRTPSIIDILSNEEFIFLLFISGIVKGTTLPDSKYFRIKLNKVLKTANFFEIGIICESAHILKYPIHVNPTAVNVCLEAIIDLPNDFVLRYESSLVNLFKAFKKCDVRYSKLKIRVCQSLTNALPYMEPYSKIRALEFLAYNGSDELNVFVDSICSSTRYCLSDMRIKDLQSFVRSLVSLGYKEKSFYVQIAKSLNRIDDRHFKFGRHFANILVQLSYVGVYELSHIQTLFKSINENEDDFIKALMLLSCSPSSNKNVLSETISSNKAYMVCLSGVLDLDLSLNLIGESVKILPTVRIKLIRNIIPELPVGSTDVKVSNLLVKDLSHIIQTKPYVGRVLSHSNDAFVVVGLENQILKPLEYKIIPDEPVQRGKIVLFYIPKRLYFLKNFKPNGHLIARKRLLETLGYKVVLISPYFYSEKMLQTERLKYLTTSIMNIQPELEISPYLIK